jgi:hypothetical protein
MEDAFHATACSSVLSSVLGFKTVLEEGRIAVTDLNRHAVFMLKHLTYIPKALGFQTPFCDPSLPVSEE